MKGEYNPTSNQEWLKKIGSETLWLEIWTETVIRHHRTNRRKKFAWPQGGYHSRQQHFLLPCTSRRTLIIWNTFQFLLSGTAMQRKASALALVIIIIKPYLDCILSQQQQRSPIAPDITNL